MGAIIAKCNSTGRNNYYCKYMISDLQLILVGQDALFSSIVLLKPHF